MERDYLLGVDIGGTFTDFVMCRVSTGEVWLGKRLTTPDEPARAVREGLVELMAQAGTRGAGLQVVIHGTTLITNALIERKGVRTALLATEGYRDVLEVGTEMRYDAYDLFLEVPEPLVPRPVPVKNPVWLVLSRFPSTPTADPVEDAPSSGRTAGRRPPSAATAATALWPEAHV